MKYESDDTYPVLFKDGLVENQIELIEKDKTLLDEDVHLPDFFICGAAKSGTTSLFNYLGQHPRIFTPRVKEPGYFSALRPMKHPDQYAQLFKGARTNVCVGEASGAYLTSPDSAARLAALLPESKIIVMLRNPADRAFSLYRHMVHHGHEWAPSFRNALQLEYRRWENDSFLRQNPEYYYNFMYRITGLYSQQLENLKAHFSESQIKIVIFENFVEDPECHTRSVFRFLGLDDSLEIDTPVYNKEKRPFSTRMEALLNKAILRSSQPFVESLFETLNYINRNVSIFTTRETNVNKRIRKRLLEWYNRDIRKVSRIVEDERVSRWIDF